MIVTSTIKDLILDPNRTGEIREYIADGREQYGMQTFDQHLADLVTAGEVEFEVALANATRPSDFELQMRTFRRSSRTVNAAELAAAAAKSAPAAKAPAAPKTAASASKDTPVSAPAIDGITSGNDFDFLGK